MLHVLNADAKCAMCSQTIRRGTLVSWVTNTGQSTPAGPHHIDCSPSKEDRDQAKAEEAAGFSRLELKSPPRQKPVLAEESAKNENVRKNESPQLSFKFRMELENDDRTLTLVLVSISIAILFMAYTINGLPYDFYNVLRFSVSATFALFAKQLWQSPQRYWRVAFAGIAVLYNPIVPIHLSKETWEPINMITVALLLVGQRKKQFYVRQAKSDA
jgi:hypothetical protein